MDIENIKTKKILEFIKNNPLSTSSQIAKKLSINRVTTTKYLEILKANDLISSKEIGKAKVWFENKSPLMWKLKEKNAGAHLKHLLDILGEGVIIIDKDFKVVWTNKKIRDKFGSIDEIRDKNCNEVFCNHSLSHKNCPCRKVFEDRKKHTSIKVFYPNNNDNMYCEITSSPIEDINGEIVGAATIVYELTPEKFIERRKQLVELDKKFKKLGDFL